MTGPAPLDPALAALRGTVNAKPYDARAIVRASTNPGCGVLPVAAAMAVPLDTLAGLAHQVGLGPDPRRSMSQLARQQGDTYDANLFTDGGPLLAALHADGWVPHTSINVVNIDDHVSPPRAAGLTGTGGKPTEQQWRSYHDQRKGYTTAAHARATADSLPTLLLRGVVETTGVANTPLRTFGEFDFALIFPAGTLDASLHELLGATAAAAVTLIGDGKSWRRLGRLDNGDKRANVALQVALYVTAARLTWPAAQGGTVAGTGLVANPPGTGGLGTAKLTRLDLSDPMRTLADGPRRSIGQLASALTAIGTAVAAGARLDDTDPVATTAALDALLELAAWQPACLSACPLGQTCRRRASANDDVARLGALAGQTEPVTSITRLQELRAGASPTPAEAPTATILRDAGALLGAPVSLPWPAPAPTTGAVGDPLADSA